MRKGKDLARRIEDLLEGTNDARVLRMYEDLTAVFAESFVPPVLERAQNAAPAMLRALERLVLAFDVGDMAHTTANGRGYGALEDARAAIKLARGEE